MDDLRTEELVIRVDESVPASLRLDWLGRSTSDNPGLILGPFFEQVLSEAGRGDRAVDMHFESLEYFNSAAIATLIHIINSAGKAKVGLRFHYDPDKKWQAVSFDSLRRVVHWFGSGGGPNVEFIKAHGPPASSDPG